jgi:carbon monoxide dehydrogenase subunit G
VIAAPPQQVWELVADPHHMPRWWPLAVRVEDVREADNGELAWTVVLRTDRGTTVRADFKRDQDEPGALFGWAQEVEGTPFARILKSASVQVALAADGSGTRVELTSDEALRGMSRLGGSMIRNAARRRLDEALDGIERALVGEVA